MGMGSDPDGTDIDLACMQRAHADNADGGDDENGDGDDDDNGDEPRPSPP